MTKMQPWLFDQLVTSGVVDARGVNDRPRARRCPTCAAPTIAAWQDGILDTVHVDPVALTPLGELQALSAGRRTFTHWGGDLGGLATRRATTIGRVPPGVTTCPVRPEHRCGSPPLDVVPERGATQLPPDAPPPF